MRIDNELEEEYSVLLEHIPIVIRNEDYAGNNGKVRCEDFVKDKFTELLDAEMSRFF